MEKVTIELSKESADFLISLANRIETQDNLGTATPYFFVIQTEKWRVANDSYYSGETKRVLIDVSGDADCSEYESREDFVTHLINVGLSSKEAEQYAEENLQEFTMEKYIEEDNCFLTKEAFNQHVELNGHNLGRRGEYYPYLKHSYRNPEMKNLFKAISEFKTVEKKNGV